MLIQGCTYVLSVEVSDESGSIPVNIIDKIEFVFGDVKKNYPKDARYENGVFLVSLSQQDTFSLKDTVRYQIRVKFTNGQVKSTVPTSCCVIQSLTKEVL